MLELLGEDRLEDVSQVAREFWREANADMRLRAIWWLAGLLGQHNRYRGKVWDHQPVWGAGAALVSLEHAERELATKEQDDMPGLPLESHPRDAASRRPPERLAPPPRRSTSPGPPGPSVPILTPRRVGTLLFVSGVGPRSPVDNSIPAGIEGQTRACVENVRAILEAAGSSLDRVVDVTAFLTDMERDFPTFNKVYEEYFGAVRPTRTTVEVGALLTAIDVELKVIALS